jgi:hypothetical protein
MRLLCSFSSSATHCPARGLTPFRVPDDSVHSSGRRAPMLWFCAISDLRRFAVQPRSRGRQHCGMPVRCSNPYQAIGLPRSAPDFPRVAICCYNVKGHRCFFSCSGLRAVGETRYRSVVRICPCQVIEGRCQVLNRNGIQVLNRNGVKDDLGKRT